MALPGWKEHQDFTPGCTIWDPHPASTPACSKAMLTPALEPLVLLVSLTDLGPRPLGSRRHQALGMQGCKAPAGSRRPLRPNFPTHLICS